MPVAREERWTFSQLAALAEFGEVGGMGDDNMRAERVRDALRLVFAFVNDRETQPPLSEYDRGALEDTTFPDDFLNYVDHGQGALVTVVENWKQADTGGPKSGDGH